MTSETKLLYSSCLAQILNSSIYRGSTMIFDCFCWYHERSEARALRSEEDRNFHAISAEAIKNHCRFYSSHESPRKKPRNEQKIDFVESKLEFLWRHNNILSPTMWYQECPDITGLESLTSHVLCHLHVIIMISIVLYQLTNSFIYRVLCIENLHIHRGESQ